MKVLLYLKKSSRDRSGKAPIMGRITLGRSIAQFSCKLSCNSDLWNPRESRMNGKSREAVEVNGRLDNLLLAVQASYQSLLAKGSPFDATDIKEHFQGCVQSRMIRKLFGNIFLKKKKLLGRRHWIGNEVETSEALGIARICTNKGRLSFEAAMLL